MYNIATSDDYGFLFLHKHLELMFIVTKQDDGEVSEVDLVFHEAKEESRQEPGHHLLHLLLPVLLRDESGGSHQLVDVDLVEAELKDELADLRNDESVSAIHSAKRQQMWLHPEVVEKYQVAFLYC